MDRQKIFLDGVSVIRKLPSISSVCYPNLTPRLDVGTNKKLKCVQLRTFQIAYVWLSSVLIGHSVKKCCWREPLRHGAFYQSNYCCRLKVVQIWTTVYKRLFNIASLRYHLLRNSPESNVAASLV